MSKKKPLPDVIDVTIFVIVMEDGRYELSPDTTGDDFIGSFTEASRFLKIVLKVPRPRTVLVEAEIDGEDLPESVTISS